MTEPLSYATYPSGEPILRGDTARVRAFYQSLPDELVVEDIDYSDPTRPLVMTADGQVWEVDEMIEVVKRGEKFQCPTPASPSTPQT